MIVMIDNYDSFTYNLVQYMAEFGADVRVFRNDKTTVNVFQELNPSGIVISPGPVGPKMRVFPWKRFYPSAGKFPCWACVSGTRPLPWHSGVRLFLRSTHAWQNFRCHQ